jgi:hypothetical protein
MLHSFFEWWVLIGMIKSFNLEGRRRAGQTLIGNWFEDRVWKDDFAQLLPTAHGSGLTAQPGYETKQVKTTYQKAYIPPVEQREKTLRKQAKIDEFRRSWTCPDPQRNPRP